MLLIVICAALLAPAFVGTICTINRDANRPYSWLNR